MRFPCWVPSLLGSCMGHIVKVRSIDEWRCYVQHFQMSYSPLSPVVSHTPQYVLLSITPIPYHALMSPFRKDRTRVSTQQMAVFYDWSLANNITYSSSSDQVRPAPTMVHTYSALLPWLIQSIGTSM